MTLNQAAKNIQLSELSKPIHSITQIQIEGENRNDLGIKVTRFLILTVDKKLVIVSIIDKQPNQFTSSLVELESFGTTLFFEPHSRNIYVGCTNGNIFKAELSKLDNDYEVTLSEESYYEPNSQPKQLESLIVLLYTRGDKLFSWNLKSEVKIFSKEKLEFLYNVKDRMSNISQCVSFLNPFTNRQVACVAFDQGIPPIIFDCERPIDFLKCYETGLEKYNEENLQQDEIILICEKYLIKGDIFLLPCSSQLANDLQHIIIYSIQEQQDELGTIFYMQPFYKFQVQKQVVHLSLYQSTLMVTMLDTLIFFDIQNRCQQLFISKNGLKPSFGFVIKRENNTVKMLLNQSFNVLVEAGKKFKPKKTMLKIRSKQLERIVLPG